MQGWLCLLASGLYASDFQYEWNCSDKLAGVAPCAFCTTLLLWVLSVNNNNNNNCFPYSALFSIKRCPYLTTCELVLYYKCIYWAFERWVFLLYLGRYNTFNSYAYKIQVSVFSHYFTSSAFWRAIFWHMHITVPYITDNVENIQ